MVAQARAIAAHSGDADTKAAFVQIADELEKARRAMQDGLPKDDSDLLTAFPMVGESWR